LKSTVALGCAIATHEPTTAITQTKQAAIRVTCGSAVVFGA
jgi:hypothetical protein